MIEREVHTKKSIFPYALFVYVSETAANITWILYCVSTVYTESVSTCLNREMERKGVEVGRRKKVYMKRRRRKERVVVE